MNRADWPTIAMLGAYVAGLGFHFWLMRRRINSINKELSEMFNSGLEAGMNAMFEMIKQSGVLPEGFQIKVDIKTIGEPSKKETKEEAKQDDAFLKSLNIKP